MKEPKMETQPNGWAKDERGLEDGRRKEVHRLYRNNGKRDARQDDNEAVIVGVRSKDVWRRTARNEDETRVGDDTVPVDE